MYVYVHVGSEDIIKNSGVSSYKCFRTHSPC